MILAVLDHLWQSTVVALVAAGLAAALPRAPAAIRFGLWFAASIKFLVPFAALAALGRLSASAVRLPAHVGPEAVLVRSAAQPFSQIQAAAPAAQAASATPVDPSLILLLVWALGSVAVLAMWTKRWAEIRATARRAVPLACPAPMPVLGTNALSEPGLVGLRRPVLLVPLSLFDHLSKPQIAALVAHEAEHLRRRDNLLAAIHMLVEALFWFHPLVWWIGARLIDERERACDEAVMRAGHDRAAYARALLESCRLFLQSPLPCVAGASGSDLKVRVQRIMTAPAPSNLPRPVQLLLFSLAVCAAGSPVAAGLLTAPSVRGAVPPAIIEAPAAAFSAGDRLVVGNSLPPRHAASVARPVRGRSAMFAPPVIDELHAAVTVLSSPAAMSLAAAPVISEPAVAPPPEARVAVEADAADDPERPVCWSEAITGSRFVKRVCETRIEAGERQRRLYAFEREKRLDPSGFPAASSQTPTDAERR